jgi:hypothetical protein
MSVLLQDPRQRTNVYIDTYKGTAYRADGVTPLIYRSMYDDHVLFFHKLMTMQGLDFLYSIGGVSTQQLTDYKHVTYAYIETVPITIYAVDPVGTNEGTRTLWAAEQELRRIVEANYGGSLGVLRKFKAIKPNTQDMASWKLYSKTYELEYKHVVGNYTGTSDTLTYGSGGTAGTFTFPNITYYSSTDANRDNFVDMPGRYGDYPFNLGSKSQTITIKCDLDIELPTLTWKRAQASTKTDSIQWQVFKDIIGNGITEPSQVLTVAGESHAVRLRSDLELSPDNHSIVLHFTEYNQTPASSSYKTRSGIS